MPCSEKILVRDKNSKSFDKQKEIRVWTLIHWVARPPMATNKEYRVRLPNSDRETPGSLRMEPAEDRDIIGVQYHEVHPPKHRSHQGNWSP